MAEIINIIHEPEIPDIQSGNVRFDINPHTVRIALIISAVLICGYQMQYLLIQKGYFLTIPYLPC